MEVQRSVVAANVRGAKVEVGDVLGWRALLGKAEEGSVVQAGDKWIRKAGVGSANIEVGRAGEGPEEL